LIILLDYFSKKAAKISADRPEHSQRIPPIFSILILEKCLVAISLMLSKSNPRWMSPISVLNSSKLCLQRSTIMAFPLLFITYLMLWKTFSGSMLW
jgi:hypothetical protein